MKILLLLRHAKSSWDENLPDHERPLNRRGKEAAPRMGLLLQREELLPDRVLCSTARRAKDTLDRLLNAAEHTCKVKHLEGLYLATPGEMLVIAQERGKQAERLMLVGHNPGMEDLVARLTGQRGAFPTAALAVLRLPIGSWTKLDGGTEAELLAMWRPRELPA